MWGLLEGVGRGVMVKMSEGLMLFLFCRRGASSQRTAAALPRWEYKCVE